MSMLRTTTRSLSVQDTPLDLLCQSLSHILWSVTLRLHGHLGCGVPKFRPQATSALRITAVTAQQLLPVLQTRVGFPGTLGKYHCQDAMYLVWGSGFE
eukprot:1242459-Rhodomonas_salina.2